MVNLSQFSSRQLKIFGIISLINICNAFCFALQAPFFPAVAESKGAVSSEYGIVFGVFQLVIFLVSPIFGHYISVIGSKCMMVTGVMITGTMCTIFGFLIFIDTKMIFLCSSFLSRIFEAVGCAMCNTASFSIIAKEFPDNIGYAMATLETFSGLGLIIGPTVGGGLYELGGYIAPFAILGCCLILCGIFAGFFLPSIDLMISEESSARIWKLLKTPEISLLMLGTFSMSSNIGFLQATLEPHVRFMNLSPSLLGLVFIVSGLVYALLAPLWGKLCDRGVSPLLLTIFGAIFIVDAFQLLGPAPYIPCKPSLRLIIVSLVLNGIGCGGLLIPSFTGAHRFAIEAGFEQNMMTLGTVSSLWTSTFALGAFLGPTLGGILKDLYGFRYATLYICTLHSSVILFNTLFLCTKKIRAKLPLPVRNMEGNLLEDSLLSESGELFDSQSPSYGSTESSGIKFSI